MDNQTMYRALGIGREVYEFSRPVLDSLSERFLAIDEIAEFNQLKVLKAMQDAGVAEAHLMGTNGYGYSDIGRDALEKTYAGIFGTEDALVRSQIICGTHALALSLQANLRPGDEILSPVGKPYDTLEEVIGIRKSRGSLSEFGISYREVPLNPDGSFRYEELPAYAGLPSAEVNGGLPYFAQEDLLPSSYEHYSPLDSLGRCGPAMANVGRDLMPDEPRGPIGMIKPTGWHTVRYDDLIGDRYLYNRCHLLAYQLTGENANPQNLITGTRYMNVEGMLPYERRISDYVKSSGRHVLLRVTPVFLGEELVARGVLMEAYSSEDEGEGVCFNAFVYNVQPGIIIDYATGDSRRAEG